MNKLTSLAESMIGSLYPYQLELYNNTNNEIIINKSRQVGMSYAVACMALIKACAYGRTELIVSPSLRQSTHMMEYVYEFLTKLRKQVDVPITSETKTSIIFGGGNGAIHSLPNSANTVRGFPADDIYLDEFAHFTCGTDKDIIDAITPSISRGGNIYYISTPFADQNLYYKYWNKTGISKQLINWRDCPDFKEDNILSIKSTIGLDAFNQEYENMFLSDRESQEFPTALIHGCIDHDLCYVDELDNETEYWVGVDIGRKHDKTAIVAISKKDECYTIRKIRMLSDTAYDDPEGNGQLQQMEYILNNYTIHRFTIDESGIGNMLAEKLAQTYDIERITFNNENKQEMVGNLKKVMQEGRLRYPNDPLLIDSIRAIERIYSPSNFIRFDSGRDSVIGHADLFWALALALKDCDGDVGFKVMYG